MVIMRKNSIIALMLTIVLVLTMVAPAMAMTLTPEEQAELDRQEYVSNRISELRSAGQPSSDELYSAIVDLSNIDNSTVTATVYGAVYAPPIVTTYTNIRPQPISGANGAKDKVSRFWFYIRNNNRDHVMALWGSAPEDTVIGYVYGPRKLDMLSAFVIGIPECLEQQRLYDNPSNGGGSFPTKPAEPKETTADPDAWAEKYLTTVFSINQTSYTVTTVNTAEPNTGEGESIVPIIKTMDVAPYIKEDRTYVPVRYLAYSLGVAEDGVTWDGQARRVGISKDDTDIALIIGSPVMYVDGQPVKMDVAPEITNDRTFLPARWVAEALGAEVEWDDATKQAIIKMPVTEE
jgi:hypothetical protein